MTVCGFMRGTPGDTGEHLSARRACQLIPIHVYEQAFQLLEKEIPHAAQQHGSNLILLTVPGQSDC